MSHAYKVEFEGTTKEIIEKIAASPYASSQPKTPPPPARTPPSRIGIRKYTHRDENMPTHLKEKRIGLVKRYRQELNLNLYEALNLANMTLEHLANN